MKFNPELLEGTLIRRYKRFLTDIYLGGERITVHCPNTGRMTNCVVEGSPCWVVDSDNPKRKYRYSWELATTPTGHIAGINTLRANALVNEAIVDGVLQELQGYDRIQREVVFGEQSRVDFCLSTGDERCWVEVKSVTLGTSNGCGLFPDARSVRALKHLQELISAVRSGDRAVLVFCVQHTGIESVAAAKDVDPEYASMLRLAIAEGVEVIAYQASLSPVEARLSRALPVILA